VAIMEVVLKQTFVNQEVVNRFNYLSAGTPAAVSLSFALVSALGAIPDAGVYPEFGLCNVLAQIQSTGVTFSNISAKNVYSVTDFYDTPFTSPLSGAIVAGNSMSPTMAIGFRTNRTRLDIRRGTKRFVGANESVISSGGVLDATYKDGVVADLAEALGAIQVYDDEGQELSFTPIICGKEQYVPDPAHPERTAYRYYATEAEQLQHIMSSLVWDSYDQVRTQASRQYGRGR